MHCLLMAEADINPVNGIIKSKIERTPGLGRGAFQKFMKVFTHHNLWRLITLQYTDCLVAMHPKIA